MVVCESVEFEWWPVSACIDSGCVRGDSGALRRDVLDRPGMHAWDGKVHVATRPVLCSCCQIIYSELRGSVGYHWLEVTFGCKLCSVLMCPLCVCVCVCVCVCARARALSRNGPTGQVFVP